MALAIKKLPMSYGVEFTDVYFKLNRLSYNDEDGYLYFAGAFYLNESARKAGLEPIEDGILCETVKLPDKTVNLYEFVYNYIKQKAAEVGAMSDEEIANFNIEIDKKIEQDENYVRDYINPNYKLFVDAQDC